MNDFIRSAFFLGLLALVGLGGSKAFAEPTDITVRVISKGAKFVGTSMGGVAVTVRDVQTGELLASGTTAGGTGDTTLIMNTAHERGGVMSSEGAAAYTATIDIDEPVLVEVRAEGPLAQRQSLNSVSATQWVVPGKDVSGGDGFLLELPGFVVDVLGPPAHIKLSGLPQEIVLDANVTMMCGCPITPDGLWDANAYEVSALLKRNGELVKTVPLSYAGAASQFSGSVSVEAAGVYEAIVYAYDPANGNTGLDRVTFSVAP